MFRLSRQIFSANNSCAGAHWPVSVLCCATLKFFPLPPKYDVTWPLSERRKLPHTDKVPPPPAALQKHLRVHLQPYLVRGPEEVHNKLVYRQFGIQALQGGNLQHGHFQMIWSTVNRKMDDTRMFAKWRIDGPWLPRTRKAQGSRMGGGKGKIHHFETPVKAERIIIEVGGQCDFVEVNAFLKTVAHILPFKARVVSQQMLDDEAARLQFIEQNNINPFTFEYCAKNNFLGCNKFLTPYDWKWFGRYR